MSSGLLLGNLFQLLLQEFGHSCCFSCLELEAISLDNEVIPFRNDLLGSGLGFAQCVGQACQCIIVGLGQVHFRAFQLFLEIFVFFAQSLQRVGLVLSVSGNSTSRSVRLLLLCLLLLLRNLFQLCLQELGHPLCLE